jgi:hypothetical protein
MEGHSVPSRRKMQEPISPRHRNNELRTREPRKKQCMYEDMWRHRSKKDALDLGKLLNLIELELDNRC